MTALIDRIAQPMLKDNIPNFRPGDTVVVHVDIEEGSRKRKQAFEGVVISRRHRGANSSFTVRKISSNIGVERVFPLHSPHITIELKREGRVRRANLNYLRQLRGRKARIKQRNKPRSQA